MRLRFCLLVTLGALLLVFSNMQPASASHRSSGNFPASQASGSSVVFEHLTIEDGLSQNAGLALLQDQQGFIWIGTQDGLNRYDGYGFTIFKHDPEDLNSISYNSVIALHEDQENNLWIGTWGGGLDRFNPYTGHFAHYRHASDDPTSVADDTIMILASDDSGGLWIGTLGAGLDYFDVYEETFTHYRNDPANSNIPVNDNTR